MADLKNIHVARADSGDTGKTWLSHYHFPLFSNKLIFLQGFGYINSEEILTIRFEQQKSRDGWQDFVLLGFKNSMELTGMSKVTEIKNSLDTSELLTVKDWECFLNHYDFSNSGIAFLQNQFRI